MKNLIISVLALITAISSSAIEPGNAFPKMKQVKTTVFISCGGATESPEAQHSCRIFQGIIDIKGTNAFQYYRTFRYNFYPEGTDGYVFPRGKHTVYMRYNDCEGNIKKVVFYGHELGDDEQGQMADPTYNAVHLPASQATVVNPDEFPETRLNDDGAFGWTVGGLMVKYSGVDFKDGKTYGQIAVVSSHGGSTNPDGFLELYVDNADSEDNMIAKIWTARDWRWVVYAPLAANLKKEISGKHDLIVKWTAQTNLKEVQLIEGTPWELDEEDQPVKVELVDEPLSPNAYGMHFDAMGRY